MNENENEGKVRYRERDQDLQNNQFYKRKSSSRS